MMQTFEAVVDEKGRVHLLESVELKTVRRAFVTLLPDFGQTNDNSKGSLQHLGEILDEDLENASREIAETFRNSLKNSVEELAE